MVVVVVCMMDDQLIDWRYDVGLLQEESDRGMQNKKKSVGSGVSHIMLGLADEPEQKSFPRLWKKPGYSVILYVWGT